MPFDLAAEKGNLGAAFLYAMTEVGDVNSYLHVWAYDGMADREKKRAAMADDPDRQAYLPKCAGAGPKCNCSGLTSETT